MAGSAATAEAAVHTAAKPADLGGISRAAASPAGAVLERLGVTAAQGLPAAVVASRAATYGPNTVSSHRARLWPVLWRQLRSPLLLLLFVTAAASFFIGERSDAVIICVILLLSVGLGFGNEYRAEKAAESLHDEIRHETTVVRDAQPHSVSVTELVPGDIVRLHLGDIVPADVRLL